MIWGGDEFAVIIEDLKRPEDAGLVAQKILDTINNPFDLKNHELFITASIGITVYPWDSREDLFKDADAALYRAKGQGRNNFQYYTLEMLARTSKQSMLESYLHHALQRDEFQLHYQPLVELRSRRIVGVEALLRWQHPELGPVPTMDFMSVAEKTGLIVPIGEWVLRSACAQCHAWHQAGLAPIRMAVSVSARQLRQRDFADMVKRVLEQTGLAPEYLEIQITEGLIEEDMDRVSAALSYLKELNVRAVLDDFGTGACSLKCLKELPFDALKIDQSFINNIDTEPTNVAIAIAIISLSRALDKEVIAEGVQTEEELAFLRVRQAMTGQGNLFSYPLPAHSVEQCLTKGPLLENSDLH